MIKNPELIVNKQKSDFSSVRCSFILIQDPDQIFYLKNWPEVKDDIEKSARFMLNTFFIILILYLIK